MVDFSNVDNNGLNNVLFNLEYFKEKMYEISKIPKSFLDIDSTADGELMLMRLADRLERLKQENNNNFFNN